MIFLLNPSVFAATVIVSLTGLATDSLGNYALNNTSIGYSVAGSVSSQKWQSSANASVASDIGGATGTTFTPIIGSNVTNYHFIRVAVTIGGLEYYSPWTRVANLPMVAGTDLDLSFTVGLAVSNINLLQNWTFNGNTVSSYTITGTDLPTGISASSTSTEVRLSGTANSVTADETRTLQVTDGRGRIVSDTFTLEVTNPVSIDVPVTTYSLTGNAASVTGIGLTVTAQNTLQGTGTGNFTVSVTQPSVYQGLYTTDISEEGASANLNFDSIETAPMCIVKPSIARSVDADGSGTDTPGDTFVATPGLWLYDAADEATVTVSGQWRLDGTPIGGALALTRLQPTAGVLTYIETVTGAGVTRTSISNSRTVNTVSNTINVPLTTYTLTIPNAQIGYNFWVISPGNTLATVTAFPNVPTIPAWSITAGDASATIDDYPGEI